ncbi:MAG: AraC family ligand binding domain-containing protein, partial [Clostridia bacterium]|nr:AraC family ligand binding domain-containing protein [Clostridia bacterium]
MKPRYRFVKDYTLSPLRLNNFNIIQIGRRFCSPGEVIKAHTHKNYYELTIVTSGEGIVKSNGESYKIKSGEVHLSIPCDIHEIITLDNSELEYDFLSFYCTDDELESELNKISYNLIKINSRIIIDNKINSLVSNCILEFSTDKPYGQKIIENALSQIAVYLVRNFNNPIKENVK